MANIKLSDALEGKHESLKQLMKELLIYENVDNRTPFILCGRELIEKHRLLREIKQVLEEDE